MAMLVATTILDHPTQAVAVVVLEVWVKLAQAVKVGRVAQDWHMLWTVL